MTNIRNTAKALVLSLAVGSILTSCELGGRDFESFENKTFLSQRSIEQLLLQGEKERVATVKTAMAQPASEIVSVTYCVDPALMSEYKEKTDEQGAILLGEDYYKIEDPKSIIPAGGVTGSEVTVSFQNLSDLDLDQVYILPIRIKESSIAYLPSKSTHFFVLRGAALINTVGNISENYLAHTGSGQRSALELGGDFTAEALIRVDKFGKLISTIMGVEGGGLIRIGDAGLPDNQIQFAGPRNNATNKDWTLPTQEWTHIALTYTKADGTVRVYINGVDKGVGDQTVGSGFSSGFDWSNGFDNGFYIGKSYDDNRWLEGDIAEVRVWNRILTPEEINAKNHFYKVEPDAEGLIAYWKFNEGKGDIVKDYSSNGNDLRARKPISWKSVELPTK